MKIKILTIAFILVSTFSISHAEDGKIIYSDEYKERFNTFLTYISDRFLGVKEYEDEARKAAYDFKFVEYYKLKCKILNNLEEVLKATEANLDIPEASEIRTHTKGLLKTEYEAMKKGQVTKEDLCNGKI